MTRIATHILSTLAGSLAFWAVLLFLTVLPAHSQSYRILYGLKGEWKFELGDDMKRANPDFDDHKWVTIYAPDHWEEEGFPGYDGYAWYRKHFQANEDWNTKSLYLLLGKIDDVDQVFVNGKLVGSTGSFPPAYRSAWDANREYYLPVSYLNIPGDNVVAVRVYDDQLAGGIYEGTLGVYEDMNALAPDLQLTGLWKFKLGDNLTWRDPSLDDGQWANITVPGYWERQGYPDYDGYAWYRLRFRVPANFADMRMVLLAGFIDDFDETYLNGQLVGKTGTMGKPVIPNKSMEYSYFRAYTIPPGVLLPGQENVLAIRVFDGYIDGGIYRGPIGIVSREHYKKWSDKHREWFDWIFK